MSSTSPTPARNTAIDAGPIPHGGRAARQFESSDRASRVSDLPLRGATESAVRLISETAHDLRAPLTTIRESVRLVRDGGFGPIDHSMRECLSAAIDQCSCAAQLVDEMVHLHRLDSDFPAAHRRWLTIDEVKQNVEATMAPWTLPREIQLLWDGPFGQGIRTYADPSLLRRLIVNLLGNAVRATREGQPILVRVKTNGRGGAMQWSIVDQGRGIEAQDLELIAAGKTPSQSSGGLGLMISRRLAAAHFSRLKIESRVGTGTAVSFQTPTGGPVGLAARWVQHRCDLANDDSEAATREPQQIHNVFPQQTRLAIDGMTPPRRVRIDVPAQTIQLGIDDLRANFPDQAYLAALTVGAAVGQETVNAFGDLLDRSMRVTEWAYRTGRRSWMILWDADAETGARKQMELERLAHAELETLRLRWGVPVSVAIDALSPQRTVQRLADMLVCETLRMGQQHVADDDAIPGDPLSQPASVVPETRLDRHVRWLRDHQLG